MIKSKKRAAYLLWPLFAGISLPAISVELPRIRYVGAEQPPYLIKQGLSAGGPFADLFRQVNREAGIQDSYEIVPPARAYSEAQKTPDTCALLILRSPERESLFTWVGPIIHITVSAYIAPGSFERPQSFDDLRSGTIGILEGAAYKKLLVGQGLTPDETYQEINNAKKLASGRIKFWVTNQFVARTISKEAKLPMPEKSLDIAAYDVYVACNKKLNGRLIQKLNERWDAARRKGLLKDMGL
ncbi:transporter substrate-binding domain-containing protein [Burkholderiaceae bacterium DAT-1]|nr:transporter substrate-binding domain-containing protein [Burkholderiaceae bacterium DAT-1]